MTLWTLCKQATRQLRLKIGFLFLVQQLAATRENSGAVTVADSPEANHA
ncbi:hypothetical protein J7394_03315 [Ruegeria sp. R13_0]|nr:hypothetical protein [Ruegeria sp. R13_0]MBO9433218.1 hypothetical protein [Ruegeria sp. R13_0]